MSSTDHTRWPTWQSGRELVRLAWPFILTNSCWTLQIVLDRILLSRSSTEAVGAGMAAVMMFWSALSLFQWTTNYATTFVAQYTGAGQPHRIGAVVGQALWFATFSGLAFLLLVPMAGPIVALSGHDPDLQALEAVYFRCLCFSALPFLVTAAASSFFAGRGASTTVLLINVIGLSVNAFWAVVLIYGLLGFAPMGIAGAGWATGAGTSTSAVVAVLLALRPQHIQVFNNGRGWGFDRPLFWRLMYYGVPQGIGTALETLAFSAFLIFIGRLGTADLAATSIACTLNLLAFLPLMGIGQTIEVLVGQYLGADRPQGAERAVWTGLLFAVSATLLVAATYALLPHLLAWPFRTVNDPAGWEEVSARVPLLLRFVAVYCLFDCLNVVFAFALRGAGDTRFVTAVSLLVAWPVMVLPTYLAWRQGWGLYPAWAFASLYVVVVAMVYLARFLQGRWKQLRVIEMPGEGDTGEEEWALAGAREHGSAPPLGTASAVAGRAGEASGST
ncbi:MAG: MATE family efflux transporter [Gemmataceae bacterium]